MSWLDSLTDAARDSVFVAMRAMRAVSDTRYQQANALAPRNGEIAVGAGQFDQFIQADSIASFLRHLSRGANPEQAAALTKVDAREAVDKHNIKRPKDLNWTRWESYPGHL